MIMEPCDQCGGIAREIDANGQFICGACKRRRARQQPVNNKDDDFSGTDCLVFVAMFLIGGALILGLAWRMFSWAAG